MSAIDPTQLAQARVIASSPAQTLLDLQRAARDGVQCAVVTSDVQGDRALDDPRAAFEACVAKLDGLRVIGPASGGVVHGPGDVALVSAIGPLAPRIAQAIGPALGLAVDLGLAWDLSAAELVDGLIDAGIRTLGLALPATIEDAASPYRDLAPALQRARGRVAVFALTTDPAALTPYGVACVRDLGALARALATPESDRPRGPRIGVVTGTGPLAAFVVPAFEAAGLRLASPSQATIDFLAGELPLGTRIQPLIQIPGATERHATLVVENLRSDLRVEHVFAFDLPGFPARDPHLEAPHLSALATASQALAAPASELPTLPEPTRALALVAASILMRRTHLGYTETCALLAACGLPSATAPTVHAANLALATSAAKRMGYPVLLGAEVVADEDALMARWESMDLAPPDRHAADPLDARRIQPAPRAPVEVCYRAHPLPTLSIAGEPLALPARTSELQGPLAPLAQLIRAISSVSLHLPEIATLTLVVDSGDQPVIVHATGAMTGIAR